VIIVINMEEFKNISIRGRMAFGIKCLEIALLREGFNQPVLSTLLERLKEFVENDRLDIWEQRVGDVAPYSILDDHPENNYQEYETVSIDEIEQLKDIYISMPEAIVNLIDLVIKIGESNLYAGVGDYSEDSFDAISEVVREVRLLNIDLPDVKRYMISPFTEYGGWGYKRSISDFNV
jgi:hypothetical protein